MCAAGLISTAECSRKIGITDRSVRRLKARFNVCGYAVFVHGNIAAYTYIVIYADRLKVPIRCRVVGLFPFVPFSRSRVSAWLCLPLNMARLGNRSKTVRVTQCQFTKGPKVRPRTAVLTLVPGAAKNAACLRDVSVALYVAVVRCVVIPPAVRSGIAVFLSPLPDYAHAVEHTAV